MQSTSLTSGDTVSMFDDFFSNSAMSDTSDDGMPAGSSVESSAITSTANKSLASQKPVQTSHAPSVISFLETYTWNDPDSDGGADHGQPSQHSVQSYDAYSERQKPSQHPSPIEVKLASDFAHLFDDESDGADETQIVPDVLHAASSLEAPAIEMGHPPVPSTPLLSQQLEATQEQAAHPVIERLQAAAIDFVVQLAASVTVEPEESVPSEEDSENENSSQSIEGPLTTRAKRKRAKLPPYKPISLVFQTDTIDGETNSQVRTALSTKARRFHLPRAGVNASKRIAMILKVVEEAISAIRQGRHVTLRDIYYRDTELFGNQLAVTTLVNALACSLQLPRADLNIVAASKGLIKGHLRLRQNDGRVIDCMVDEGCLIPPEELLDDIEFDDDVRFVLIIEKEAIFRTLISARFESDTVLGKSILITGKGFPDVASRQIGRRLSERLPDHVPMLCLVDGDAYGIEIYSTYRYGSKAMSQHVQSLNIDRLIHLGVRHGDLSSPTLQAATIPLSDQDFTKAYKHLQRDALEDDIHRELCQMLHSRKKAEIQAYSANGAQGLVQHLRTAIVAYL